MSNLEGLRNRFKEHEQECREREKEVRGINDPLAERLHGMAYAWEMAANLVASEELSLLAHNDQDILESLRKSRADGQTLA